MATALVDSPQVEKDGLSEPVQQPSPAPYGASGVGAACAKCGAQLAPDQDWCLHCGAGAPGAFGGTWRPAATVLAATLVLVLIAAAAAYAALGTSAPRAPVVVSTVAQAAPPAATTPTTPALTTPTTPLAGITKPPKIPLTASTPAATTPAPPASTTPATTKSTPTPSTGGTTETQPTPILLDTDAASTYNPYGYPASDFGDPSLTIDGDTSTAWTASVNFATAPKMAEGVLIDLKSPQEISFVKLVTSTPGMTVQVFGDRTAPEPTSITDPAWVALSHSVVIHKRHAKITLKDKRKTFQLLTLWISKAPASQTGTEAAPGHVSVNELELFPVS